MVQVDYSPLVEDSDRVGAGQFLQEFDEERGVKYYSVVSNWMVR